MSLPIGIDMLILDIRHTTTRQLFEETHVSDFNTHDSRVTIMSYRTPESFLTSTYTTVLRGSHLPFPPSSRPSQHKMGKRPVIIPTPTTPISPGRTGPEERACAIYPPGTIIRRGGVLYGLPKSHLYLAGIHPLVIVLSFAKMDTVMRP